MTTPPADHLSMLTSGDLALLLGIHTYVHGETQGAYQWCEAYPCARARARLIETADHGRPVYADLETDVPNVAWIIAVVMLVMALLAGMGLALVLVSAGLIAP